MSRNRSKNRKPWEATKPARLGGAGNSDHLENPKHVTEKRQALAERVLGPHHEAQAAIKGDRLLTGRLDAAIDSGMSPIDLSYTPLHRRASVIEAALDNFEQQRTGGPCALCGTATKRPGYFARGTMDQTPGTRPADNWPNFSNGKCGWCTEYLTDHSEDDLLTRVFQLVTGTIGEAHHTAHRADAPEAQGKGDGTPWSHVPAETLRRLVAADTRYTQFITADKRWQMSAIPGLPMPYIWDAKPERPKQFLTLSKAEAERAHREHQEWAARKAARKAAEEEERCRSLVALAARDHYGHNRSAAENIEFNALLAKGLTPQAALDKIKADLAKQPANA